LTNIVKSVFCYPSPISELEQYTAFVFDQKNYSRFPNQIKNWSLAISQTVYGPAPRLANTTIEELSYADTFIING
jgi:hypothetical protein